MNPQILTQNIRDRYTTITKGIRDGNLSRSDQLILSNLQNYAFVYKDGPSPILGMGQAGAAKPEEATDDYIPFTITVLQEDRDGDIVVPRGCLTANYARNPVIFFGHQDWEIPIGVARSPQNELAVFPSDTIVRSHWYPDWPDEDASFIAGKVKRGILSASSVAFVPIEAYRREYEEKAHTHAQSMVPPGWIFKVWDLTEWSIVGVPSNAGAIRDALDKEKSFITPRLQKGLKVYAAVAKDCWNGWCPCPPCENTKEDPASVRGDTGTSLRREVMPVEGRPSKTHTRLLLLKVRGSWKKDINTKAGQGVGPERALKLATEFVRLHNAAAAEYKGAFAAVGAKLWAADWTKPYKDSNRDYIASMMTPWSESQIKSVYAIEIPSLAFDKYPEVADNPKLRNKVTNQCVAIRDKYQSQWRSAISRIKGINTMAPKSKTKSCCSSCKTGKGCIKHSKKKTNKAGDPGGVRIEAFLYGNNQSLYRVVDASGKRVSSMPFKTRAAAADWVRSAGYKLDKSQTKFATQADMEPQNQMPGGRVGNPPPKGAKVEDVREQMYQEDKAQPSSDIDPDKACKILHDGTANGKPLTEDQRRMFGAACSRAKKSHNGLRDTCKALLAKDLSSVTGSGGGYTVGVDPESASTKTEGIEVCVTCGGTGNCTTCGGKGVLDNGDGGKCMECNGTGNCEDCDGRGETPDGKLDQPSSTRDQPTKGKPMTKKKDKGDTAPKAKSSVDEPFEPEKDAADEPFEPEKDSGDEPFNPKPSARLTAELYAHYKNGLDYLTEKLESGELEHEGMMGHLESHKDMLQKNMDDLSDGLSKHHPDASMDELVKGLESTSGGSQQVETGEEGKVEGGEVPPDAVEPYAGEETPAEEAEEDEIKNEPADDPDTEEILERYRTPKGWKTRKAGTIRRAKDGKAYLVKDLEDEGNPNELKDLSNEGNPEELVGGPHGPNEGQIIEGTGHAEVIKDAADHMESMTGAPDVPKYHHAGLHHHAKALMGVHKELTDQGHTEEDGGAGSQLSNEGNPAEMKGSVDEPFNPAKGKKLKPIPTAKKSGPSAVEKEWAKLKNKIKNTTGIDV